MNLDEIRAFSYRGLLEQALMEWYSKPRRMGCVAATKWLCSRVPSFKPIRLNLYTKQGIIFQHVVATDGIIRIDLAPYAALPNNYNPDIDGKLD